MALTHWSRPKPALETPFILSPSKTSFSLFRSFLICRTCLSFISSFLYSCRAFSRDASDSITLAPAQPASPSSLPNGLRMHTHMQTIITGGGGVAMTLISDKSFLSKFSSASAAAARAGIARVRAASASAFSAAITTESFEICSEAALASSWRLVTMIVLSLIVWMSWLTFSAFSSTMTFFVSSSLDISVTCSAACTSFKRPPSRRPDMVSRFLRLFSKNFV
mmetsp:Transcript_100923/g.285851  ORF Transcript_100923/g.285851 Transcript_100923/m.285851 type:complete len:222 (+) Transcript_100923:3566-4231(+)